MEPDHEAADGPTAECVVGGPGADGSRRKDLPVLWGDGTASRTLFSRVALGEGSASVLTVGSSDHGPVTSCVVVRGPSQVPGCAFAGSLGEPLDRHSFLQTWARRGCGLVIRP